jgi:FkbM family methyltransferase
LHALAKRLHPQRIRRTLGAASCVREPVRFVVNELRDIPIVARYQLRESGLLAEVRHPLLDMWVLEEMFRFRVYEPPAPVAASLAALGRPVRIADLGGHVGFFGLYMRGLFPSASVVSFEPDPRNATILRRCVEANGLADAWRVIEACAATSEGTTEFSSSFHLSRMAPASDGSLDALQHGISSAFPFLEGTALLETEHRSVACHDVFPCLLDADLVKVDIEGGEWEIFADERLRELDAAAVVIEYHPAYAPERDAQGTIERELHGAGYVTRTGAPGADAGMMWAWKAAGRSS